ASVQCVCRPERALHATASSLLRAHSRGRRARCVVAARCGPLTVIRRTFDDRSHMKIVTRDELEASLAELARDVRDPREGILGPSSVAWRLGGDLAIFLGGGRATLLQLAHPMVAHAIDQHSRTRSD